VRSLVSGEQAPGRYSVEWDGTTRGTRAPGLYFVRMHAGGRTFVKRLAITN
jgi:hypothetical protein